MSYKAGDTFYGYVTTRSFTTGVATDADSTPSATMYKNGSSVGACTVANVTTGIYKVSKSMSGYAAGDAITVVASATVGGVSDNAVVDSFVLDKRVDDLNDFDNSIDKVLLEDDQPVKVVKVGSTSVNTSADVKADLTTLESRLTELRAGYLDKLNVSGTLAHSDAASTYRADLSTLESRLSAARAGYLDKLNVSGVLAHIDNADSFKADISALALEATLATLATAADLEAHDQNLDDLHTKHDATDVVLNAMDTVLDTVAADILTSLTEHNTTQADIAALEAKVDVIDGNVDQIETAANAIKVQTDKMTFNVSNYIFAVGQSTLPGPGAYEVTISLSSGGVPLADCAVWITSDAGGSAVVAGTLYTDDQGDATFMLDTGVTYYLWTKKSGFEPLTGEEFTAVADE